MKKKQKIIIFLFGTLLFNIAANLAHPVTPAIIKNLQLADYMFGAAYGTMMFGNFLFSPFWGNRNEYGNSKYTMAICCIGYSVGQILFCISRTEGILLFARLFSGIFAGGVFVSFLTYLVNVSEEEQRGSYLAALAAGGSIAGAFGYFIGGMLGEVSITLVFIIQAGGLFLCGLLFLFVCENDKKGKTGKPELKERIQGANPFSAFISIRRFINERFTLLFCVCALSYVGLTAFEQSFNYYIKDVYDLTSKYNGTIKAAIGIASLITNATLCIYIIRKTNAKKTVISILAACAALIFLATAAKDRYFFIGISVLFFAVNAVGIPVIQDLISKEAGEENRGIVMGFYNGMKSLGGIIGALAAGFLYEWIPLFPFFFAGAVFLLTAFLSFSFSRLDRVGK